MPLVSVRASAELYIQRAVAVMASASRAFTPSGVRWISRLRCSFHRPSRRPSEEVSPCSVRNRLMSYGLTSSCTAETNSAARAAVPGFTCWSTSGEEDSPRGLRSAACRPSPAA
ncbi:hypothetical protein D3C80_1187290 [compost metagenome]